MDSIRRFPKDLISPENMQTVESCIEAIKYEDPEYLKLVRPDLLTSEICLIAVILQPHLIEYVRPDLQTEEMAIISLFHFNSLNYIRHDLRERAQYVFDIVKSGANLHPYNQSVHDDIHNNIVRMMKREIETSLTIGRNDDGFTKTPRYLIDYIINYYIKEINEAAANYIECCYDPDDAKNPELDWIRECDVDVDYTDMILFIQNKPIYIYDFIKTI